MEALLQQGLVVEEDCHWTVSGDLNAVADIVPEDLQQLITKQIEALSAEEQQILAVASVSGLTFTAATVATGCKQAMDTVEAACERLVQRGQVIEGGALRSGPMEQTRQGTAFAMCFFGTSSISAWGPGNAYSCIELLPSG